MSIMRRAGAAGLTPGIVPVLLGIVLGLPGAGCGGGSVGPAARVVILGSETSGGQELVYESIATKHQRLDMELADPNLAVDPVALQDLLARLHPGATTFARIAHLTDAQIREERAVLLGDTFSQILEYISDFVPAGEGSERGELQERDSPFTWAAVCQTVDWIHAEPGYGIDFALHTGDSVDTGLRSELAHFVYGAYVLDVPLFVAAGNHDISTFGLWREGYKFAGLRLDTDIDASEAHSAVFAANAETLVQGRENYATHFMQLVMDHPSYPLVPPGGAPFFGLDAPAPSPALAEKRMYYTHEIIAPNVGTGTPGLQLIVLETNRDNGSYEAELDAVQSAWLNDVLDDANTRRNLVIVSAHHPVIEVERADEGKGAIESAQVVSAMVPVRAMLSHYPNVILFLCGHTHKPEICEWRTGTGISHDGTGIAPNGTGGALEWIQIDAGSTLIAPQESGIVEILFTGDDVEVHNNRFAAMVAQGSMLGDRIHAANASAREDTQSAPRYPIPETYGAVLVDRLQVFQNMPFGVNVPKYDPSGP